MGVTKFDALGRLTLPVKVAEQLGLSENDKLLITVAEAEKRIVMRPTQEEPQSFDSAEEMKHNQNEMLRKPAGAWRYIRRMDNKRRVVLPRSMRGLLGWTQGTYVRIVLKKDAVYLEAAE